MRFLSGTAVLLIGLGVWLFSDNLPFISEVTVYQTYCTGRSVNGVCDQKVQPMNPITYKVFVEQQTVIYWIDGDKEIKRYPYCAVRDAKNWTCQWSAPSVATQQRDVMRNGVLSIVDSNFSLTTENITDVPKWRWWLVKLMTRD